MSTFPNALAPAGADERSVIQAGGTYADLKRLIQDHGLLDKDARGYMVRVLIVQLLFFASLATLIFVHLFWVQCLNAVLLAFVTAQMGFIGHDAGHRQIFRSTHNNDVVGYVLGNIQVGMSFSWWIDKHNAHHSRPNEIDCDPDIDVPMIAFTHAEALQKRGLFRFITKHQAWLFFPILMFVSIDLQISSVKFLLRPHAKNRLRDAALMLLHYGWYLGLIFGFLPIWQGLIFIAIHQAITGLYLGSVFAPNHKGMLILEHNSPIDFLRRQVLTARNVRAHPITDYWYGGLNYQIEHHLFPSMPRRHLWQAQQLIRTYCQEHAISYHETGVVGSYQEIVGFLHEVGSPLRVKVA
jgi:fatty acid desaturase